MKVYTIAEVLPDGGIGKIHAERKTKGCAYTALDEKSMLCPNLDFGIWEYSIERIDA